MPQSTVTRKLTAIVAADVLGYSRMMRADEEGTLAALQAIRSNVTDPEILAHKGRIVKTTGDGILVEFDSVVDAARCTLGVQCKMAERNEGIQEDRRIVFRVGVHLGDVIVEGDDLFGDGVNVAARLEGICEPGGLCLSNAAFEQVRDRLDVEFLDGGAHEVKNIARPIQVWRWKPGADGEPDDVAASLTLPEKPSLAVLPFANMSGDEEQEYFADGITEDLITALSHVRWLFVIARNSTFAYKGQSPDIRQVATDLGVRYVLEGSVRKAGNRIRLTGQLIDGATGAHIWAERYDRQLDDIFDLQDELTVTIAGAIGPAVDLAERERITSHHSDSFDAWEVYQQGMRSLHKRTLEDLETARRLFLRATKLDPNLSQAYAATAEACFFQIVDGTTDDPEQCRADALYFGQKGVEHDNQDSGAHYAMGRAYMVRREHEHAVPALQTAVRLNPSFAWAHYALGMAYGTSGSPEMAVEPIQMAMRLSPHDSYMGQFMVHLGEAYLFMGQHQEALTWAEASLRQPNFRWSRYGLLISTLGHLGRLDEANEAISALRKLKPEVNVTFVGNWWPISDDASREILLDGLRKAGLPE